MSRGALDDICARLTSPGRGVRGASFYALFRTSPSAAAI